MSENAEISEGVEHFFLVRCPGGPIRILGFSTPVEELDVKKQYLTTFEKKGTKAQKDSRIEWPTLKSLSKTEVLKDWRHLFIVNRRTGIPRGYREFAGPVEKKKK